MLQNLENFPIRFLWTFIWINDWLVVISIRDSLTYPYQVWLLALSTRRFLTSMKYSTFPC